ncbi:hypothetical protein E6C70_02565 [Glaciibacter flavus]|uniref:Uncharacterized protein n=1 Tax=Orlajensenia flava TaxID=2565934 RepID=A0A4S4FW20_9MICO|nr:hypothetical protein [Glaciibacter flavus]THG34983.1 hypothetical protein E6C70_02565 [Glaciibacter flavus]
MIIRRAFYYALFTAVIVLPAWTLIGWGIFGHGGWGILGLILAAPIMAIMLLVVALLIVARADVRRERAVSWADAGILTVWYACLIGFGFFGATATLFSVLGVLAAIAAFWIALGEVLRAGARSVRTTMEEFERQAQELNAAQAGSAQGGTAQRGVKPAPFDAGEVIVIRESTD